jgi:type I restriction enzyme, R subunit
MSSRRGSIRQRRRHRTDTSALGSLVPLETTAVKAADRSDLREKLRVGGGGVVFTTIQKFMPAEAGDRNAVLSDRRNTVVIADEAHRSQYDFIDGFARHMRDALPQASCALT